MAEKATAALSRVCCLARGIAFVLVATLAAAALHAEDQTPYPTWVALDAPQREVLAPLADEWDRLDPESRMRWLGVAMRYPKMTPIGQKRVKTRLRKWAALTPQQRAEARAKSKRTGQPRKSMTWAALDPSQREILEPLAGEWEQLNADSRTRWLGVAKRYPKMTPIGKKRVQTRMKKWAALTPQQRDEARAKYKRMRRERKMKKLQREWQRYQALPAEERKSLAASEEREHKDKVRQQKPKSEPRPATGERAQ